MVFQNDSLITHQCDLAFTFWLQKFPSPIKKVIEQYFTKKSSVISLLTM